MKKILNSDMLFSLFIILKSMKIHFRPITRYIPFLNFNNTQKSMKPENENIYLYQMLFCMKYLTTRFYSSFIFPLNRLKYKAEGNV